MRKLLSVIIIIILVSGCSEEKGKISHEGLKKLISEAVGGNESANNSLSGLFTSFPQGVKPVEIIIDTLSINKKIFFAAAVKFQNEFNNHFALYDEYLNCYIIDRSLNGDMQLATINTDLRCFTVKEIYFTNDSIELNRFSLYQGDPSGFNLSFRTFTKMKTVDTVFLHNLEKISPTIIKTRILAPQFSGLNNFTDDYIYDRNLKKFEVGRAIYFDEFVAGFINSIKDTVHKFAGNNLSDLNY